MRLSCLLLAASAAITLASCGTGGRVDASYPTVAELDRLDTQWGLPARTSRGAPKRTYQYSAPTPTYGAPAAPSAPSAPPREVLNTPPPDINPVPLDPALR